MNQWRPHPKSAFEGYYGRFVLPSGASLAFILCWIPRAKQKPYMLSLTYVPQTGPLTQHELWVSQISTIQTSPNDSFEIQLPGIGYMRSSFNGVTEYAIDDLKLGISFHAKTSSRTPWSIHKPQRGPEGLYAHLPLPLHWYVHSLSSPCTFSLSLRGTSLPQIDTSGIGKLHLEKNWAKSFPRAHIWIQARKTDLPASRQRGFCAAGGEVLGTTAFIIGYRSLEMDLDFKPPFALSAHRISPFLSIDISWENRSVKISIQSFTRKLVVSAKAPVGSFFTLSSPFPEGHRKNYLAQSFQATLEIEIFERKGLRKWNLVKKDHFEGAALEFGGAYYPLAGTDNRSH